MSNPPRPFGFTLNRGHIRRNLPQLFLILTSEYIRKLSPSGEQADEVCGIIRGVIAKLYSADAAEAFTVPYGGSMNAKNAAELLSKVNVDGGLIGGASLKTADFTTIVNAAQ